MKDLADLGKEYTLSHLEESNLDSNPFKQFDTWFEDAIACDDVKEVNAMTLATVDKRGHVSARMMLCKSYDEAGFVFFTNYHSHKAKSLLEHPQAAIQFWWPALERQVRIEGLVQKLNPQQSDLYFSQRNKESNLVAILSKQDQPLPDKAIFINEYERLREKQEGETTLNRPDYWGGFILKPTHFEFWQGGPHRLHDRLCYEQKGDNWEIIRLYP